MFSLFPDELLLPAVAPEPDDVGDAPHQPVHHHGVPHAHEAQPTAAGQQESQSHAGCPHGDGARHHSVAGIACGDQCLRQREGHGPQEARYQNDQEIADGSGRKRITKDPLQRRAQPLLHQQDRTKTQDDLQELRPPDRFRGKIHELALLRIYHSNTAEAAEAVEEKAEEAAEAVEEKVEETAEKAEEKAEEATEAVEEKVEEAAEKAEEKVEEAAEKVEEKADEAAEKVEEKADEAAEAVQEAADEAAKTAEG